MKQNISRPFFFISLGFFMSMTNNQTMMPCIVNLCCPRNFVNARCKGTMFLTLYSPVLHPRNSIINNSLKIENLIFTAASGIIVKAR